MENNSKGRRYYTGNAIDIHGRIEALDQSLRSVDYRLRAVEKSLSIKTPAEELRTPVDVLSRSIHEIKNEGTSGEISVRIDNLEAEVSKLNNKMNLAEDITYDNHSEVIGSMEAQLADAQQRITKLENQNKVSIGKIKVPLELSGLVAAVVLIITGYLISIDQWNIIRSPYYPVIIGILFGAVAIAKSAMTNRDKLPH